MLSIFSPSACLPLPGVVPVLLSQAKVLTGGPLSLRGLPLGVESASCRLTNASAPLR